MMAGQETNSDRVSSGSDQPGQSSRVDERESTAMGAWQEANLGRVSSGGSAEGGVADGDGGPSGGVRQIPGHVAVNSGNPVNSGTPVGTPLVSLRAVTKTYPGPLIVLRNVTIDIGASEDVAVVGPSGSGKTTMLSIMGMLDHPTLGEVWIDGVNTGLLPESARAQMRAEAIGFVFQQFFLLPTLSAVDNVAEGMLYQGMRRTERKHRAMEALDRVGLGARANHRPGQLSGGEQQRVAIARAIAGGPRLIFADEPTGALDQTSGHMVVDYLQTIAGDGTTVVVITHDQGLASRFTRQISLLDGEIVADEGGVVRQKGVTHEG